MLKHDIINTLSTYKNDGTISSSSVYLRKFFSSEWININGSETYSPGSMLKVPELITYLKMSEKTPGLLEKKLLCDNTFPDAKKAVIVTKTISKGQYYTIRELLEYMIQYSDNNATYLLTQHMDAGIFRQVFEDVGLPVPDRQSKAYPITAADYSKFMRTLFNGSYLTAEHSEFAIKMLSKSDFKNGIARSIPEDVRVAHKFGEEGNMNNQELHESAIVYMDNTPYVLTIMTRGKNLTRQTKVLSTISALVYQSLSAQKTL
ncbi:MAG: serine hydrolase [Bacteroidales bacterium]|nr:serine hydrolase [Bacteroidales bacterium]